MPSTSKSPDQTLVSKIEECQIFQNRAPRLESATSDEDISEIYQETETDDDLRLVRFDSISDAF